MIELCMWHKHFIGLDIFLNNLYKKLENEFYFYNATC